VLLKILHQDAVYVGEVKYYFLKIFGDEQQAFALVSLFSPPNEHILKSTQTTLPVCRYYGESALMVINVKSILSVVAMIPFPFLIDGHGEQYFMVEQIGLDVIEVDSLEDTE
jgi:hypothetical protein